MKGCIETGWERKNRTHFDEIVGSYDKVRWNYPKQMFNDIFEYSLNSKGKNAIEIGPGTGKATTPVLEAGYDVTAIELSTNMAKFLHSKHEEHKNLNIIIAPFEDILLTEENYDLIYSASAFHWLDAEIACPKVFKLLKPYGTFALLRNNVYTADGEVLYEKIQEVYRKYYFSYYTSKERWSRKSYDDLKEPSGILQGFGFNDMSIYGFSDIIINFYEETITYSANDYIDLLDTMSDHRNLPEDYRVALYKGIKEVILKHGGQYSQDSVFTLYMGRR
ncbi:MAG: class I SAM-dependent methyltransferase [Treponema sp.]|nr:class I SAM-dependent methyltransferase [Treponema sp.]